MTSLPDLAPPPTVDIPQRKALRRDAGFTLIELLVVIAILGLLATIATPQVVKYLGSAKSKTASAQIEAVSAALDLFRLDVGRYPTQDEGLQALITKPGNLDSWNGPYIKKGTGIVDPWSVPFQYKIPGDHGEYDLFSLGADRAEGGEGENRDIKSWQ